MSNECYVAYRPPTPEAEAVRRYIIENIDFGSAMRLGMDLTAWITRAYEANDGSKRQ